MCLSSPYILSIPLSVSHPSLSHSPLTISHPSLSQYPLPNYLPSSSPIYIYHTNLALLPILSLSLHPSLSIAHSLIPPSPNSYLPFTPLPLTSLRCLYSRYQEVTCTISSALSCMRSSFSLLMRRTASTWLSRSRLAHRSSSVRDDLIVHTFHVYRCIYYIVYLISY